MKKKFKKKRKIFDFFLFCIFTQKVLTRKERFLFLYIHVREREREERGSFSSSSSERSCRCSRCRAKSLFSPPFLFCALFDERIFPPFFFLLLKLRKKFRMMREEEEEEEEQTMHTTTTNTVHELRVIVRDARGMREETPLRVHAKFDDEEKMTVSKEFISPFFCCLCALSRENLLTKECS